MIRESHIWRRLAAFRPSQFSANTAIQTSGLRGDPTSKWSRRAILSLPLWTVCSHAAIRNPYGLVTGPDGALYVCEIDTHRISRLDLKTGKSTDFVTGPDLQQPYEVRFDKRGDLYFVDMPGHKIYKFAVKTKTLSVIAGTGQPGFSGDGGPALQAQFKQPHSIVFDPQGRLLVCDIGNQRIRRIDLKTGIIETLGEPMKGPRAIDFDKHGTLWLALREGNMVMKLENGKWQAVAGTGEKGYTDGVAREAKLNGPKGIACAPDGTVYIADTENHCVRRIDPKAGTITTVAKGMKRPHGVFVDRKGTIYVGDSENHRVTVIPGPSAKDGTARHYE